MITRYSAMLITVAILAIGCDSQQQEVQSKHVATSEMNVSLMQPFVSLASVEIRAIECSVREYTVRSTRSGNEYNLLLQVDPETSCELVWRVTDDLYLTGMTADSLGVQLDSPDGSLLQSGGGSWEDTSGHPTSTSTRFTPAQVGMPLRGLIPRDKNFRLRLRTTGSFPIVTRVSIGFMTPVNDGFPPN
ncbi:hypothetical protein HQ524_04615 [Candidatus Uhrbacteria bacterium]|nr:hypothetical protein [Candidatus Uhrbacteria bacterium]